ncbi:hypothetical protein H5410_035902 [Solanum commersonii]|uniref:Uncharacterized protein n=1 Tax=Solanum commersonii TaxID=4109 RepID=A0A9J5Y6J7_SOLCO|nr:hypothetical protein H5410_035902 [Solanum commersonii]
MTLTELNIGVVLKSAMCSRRDVDYMALLFLASVTLRGTNHAKALLDIGLAFHELVDDDIPIDKERLCTSSDVESDSYEKVDPAKAGDEVEWGDAKED